MNKEACCDVCTPPHNVPVHTLSAPILLVGHGADELFAGYGRYATAGRHGGPESVRTELIKYAAHHHFSFLLRFSRFSPS